MKVAVLGSGSGGNALAIATDGSTVLVDAGFGLPTLTRRAAAVGLDIERVDTLLLTHEHNDHARGAAALARHVGCPVYGSPGTLAALSGTLGDATTRPLPEKGLVQIGPLDVITCPTSHDAAQPLAFALRERQTGATLGVAYDLGRPTAAILHLLADVACLVLEANHDDHLLRTGPYPPMVRDRIAGPRGHLSNRAAADLAGDLAHRGLQTVVLAHLSERCNRAHLAKEAVRRALERRGFRGRLLVASQEQPLAFFEVGPSQYALDVFA